MALTSHIPTGEKTTDMVAAPIKFCATFERQKRDLKSRPFSWMPQYFLFHQDLVPSHDKTDMSTNVLAAPSSSQPSQLTFMLKGKKRRLGVVTMCWALGVHPHQHTRV